MLARLDFPPIAASNVRVAARAFGGVQVVGANVPVAPATRPLARETHTLRAVCCSRPPTAVDWDRECSVPVGPASHAIKGMSLQQTFHHLCYRLHPFTGPFGSASYTCIELLYQRRRYTAHQRVYSRGVIYGGPSYDVHRTAQTALLPRQTPLPSPVERRLALHCDRRITARTPHCL